jgi:hypothetical protein
MNWLLRLFCRVGLHSWLDKSHPVVGYRNLDHWNEDHTAMIIEKGPEETFYPNPYGPIYPSRDCVHCQKRQIFWHDRWV